MDKQEVPPVVISACQMVRYNIYICVYACVNWLVIHNLKKMNRITQNTAHKL